MLHLQADLTVVERIDLLEDPAPAVAGHLVDDLDGVLGLGVDVNTGLHAGVGALPQHLPSQAVQLLTPAHITNTVYQHFWRGWVAQ